MQKQLSTLKIIHFAIFIAPLLFVLFPYLESRPVQESALPLQILVVSSVLVPVSSFLRRFLAAKARTQSGEDKFSKYQTMKILTWALVEAAALMNGAVYFLFGATLSLGAVIAFCLLNLVRFPNLREFEELFGEPSDRIR
ncbi:hypothetical protein CH371_12855 [Leptospira wolffii]|uniref:Uncharacterized protein n=1 Tax=Leptospira wolffii TaxID=409998 RepID=A0A2M9ZA62_9LEPT|nr:hypothetical protein [Leptospira wolffii]PJZ65283.1 hypothetical protein CH371_12855 [Leptospira wolffii]